MTPHDGIQILLDTYRYILTETEADPEWVRCMVHEPNMAADIIRRALDFSIAQAIAIPS